MLAKKRPLQLFDGDNEGRRLIRERERTLKGMRARLSYAEARRQPSWLSNFSQTGVPLVPSEAYRRRHLGAVGCSPCLTRDDVGCS